MKVLHYADSASLSWKMPYIAHMKAMAGLGVEQTLLCRSGETLERLAKENEIPVRTWKPLTAAVSQLSPGFVSVVKEIAPDIIHTRLLSAAGIAETWRSRLGIPIVTTFDKPGKAKYYENIDRYISCAGWLKDYMAEHEGLPAEKIEVVHNPADTARFSGRAAHRNESRALLHIVDDEILISGMGIYIPRKGFDVLLRAFGTLCKKHNNLRLALIGGGGDQREAYLKLAAELPTVASDIAPCTEIIRDGENGLIAKKDDAADFARALEQMLDINAAQRGQLVQNVQKTILNFTPEAISRKTLAVCRRFWDRKKEHYHLRRIS